MRNAWDIRIADRLENRWRRYAAPTPFRFSQALADLGEAFDVSAEDLEILLERAEHYATLRAGPSVKGANPI
jgi:hypothetical protein